MAKNVKEQQTKTNKKSEKAKEEPKTTKRKKKEPTTYTSSKDSASVEVPVVTKLTKKERQLITAGIDRLQGKDLVHRYYQLQNFRIALMNQVRTLNKQPKIKSLDDVEIDLTDITPGLTTEDELKMSQLERTIGVSDGASRWMYDQMALLESGTIALLKTYCESVRTGRWLLANMGVGPVIAAGLLSNLDYDHHMSAAKFISYAGLNDNNRPWLAKRGKDKPMQLINETVGNAKIGYEELLAISKASQWPIEILLGIKKNRDGTYPREEVRKAISKPPYNTDLKTLCWKLGKSFVWFSTNEKSLYGRLYRQRKDEEIAKNEAGVYKEQAAISLARLKDTTTPTYQLNSEGKLSPDHIDKRAMRWVEKIFLNHLFMEIEYERTGNISFIPYIIAHGDHNDFIEPEVPFGSII